MATTPSNPEEVHESVRRYYADSALKVASAGVAGSRSCCGPETRRSKAWPGRAGRCSTNQHSGKFCPRPPCWRRSDAGTRRL